MIWQIEERSDRAEHPIPKDSLVGFLAVRLLLERCTLRAAARESHDYVGELSTLRRELAARLPATSPHCEQQRAFLIFQLAQILGWMPEQLDRLDAPAWVRLLDDVEQFDELDRRRLFHLAYEHRFRVRTLDALTLHARPVSTASERPPFQAVFCIDEREESIRRHVEEVAPAAETFGAAGYFGVVMYYRGAAETSFVPLCPVVVRPQHWVSETVEVDLLAEHERRRQTRRRVGMALQSFHGGSRRIVSGAFYATTIGLLATIPLVARVMFPRSTARLQGYFDRFIAPPPRTRLSLERTVPEASSQEECGHGFLLPEMINISERLLRDIGLTSGFSRVIFLIGHGSTSINNPHESAHDCGACGGGVGGPNTRAAAQMLNDPRVRQALHLRGLSIPNDTVFVGGLHNTSSDDLSFFDNERVPTTHLAEVKSACSVLFEASLRNSHERARRFRSASLSLSRKDAKRHMEERAVDLSQVRPEWGHATNAICIVGRRQRTRGLFLDRRAFLVSYAPEFDHLVGAHAWPEHDPLLIGPHFVMLGVLFIVAAACKSALIPFSGWLPRAMEGPTPSSAIFYGALSVHLGAFLLLRVSPVLDSSLWLSVAVVVLGLGTSALAYLAGRVQSDIKSALAFASLTQEGLIIAEIGFGFRYLSLVHLLGHACLRTLQFLCAPSLLNDHHHLEEAIGTRPRDEAEQWHERLSSKTQRWLYRLALDRGDLDNLLERFFARPFAALFLKLDRLEQRLAQWLDGP